MNNFLARLKLVVSGRKKHQWGNDLGIRRGTVENALKGNIPGGDTLGVIARAENVSLTWLLTGAGPPYIVTRHTTDAEAGDHIRELFTHHSWTKYRVTDAAGTTVIVLTRPGQLKYKENESVTYTIVEIIAGACGKTAVRQLRETPGELYSVVMTTDQLDRLGRGKMGNYELLGWRQDPGRLSGATKKPTIDYSFDDAPPKFAVNENVTGKDLSTTMRQLSPEHREAVYQLISALLTAQRKT